MTRRRSHFGYVLIFKATHSVCGSAFGRKARVAALAECTCIHFLRNALDYLPRKADDDCLQEMR